MRIDTTEIHTVDDRDNSVTVTKTQVFEIDTPDLNDPWQPDTGETPTFATDGGGTVGYLGNGKFQVLDTGEILTEVTA